jgi:dTMP kinase
MESILRGAEEHIICDRWVSSNQAHQASKIPNPIVRLEIIKWIENLEYVEMGLSRPDLTIFLHVPYQVSMKLAVARGSVDGHEACEEHMRNTEATYIQLAELYNWVTVECAIGDEMRPIQGISDEIYQIVKKVINL